MIKANSPSPPFRPPFKVWLRTLHCQIILAPQGRAEGHSRKRSKEKFASSSDHFTPGSPQKVFKKGPNKKFDYRKPQKSTEKERKHLR